MLIIIICFIIIIEIFDSCLVLYNIKEKKRKCCLVLYNIKEKKRKCCLVLYNIKEKKENKRKCCLLLYNKKKDKYYTIIQNKKDNVNSKLKISIKR